eukprot:gene2603-817_t
MSNTAKKRDAIEDRGAPLLPHRARQVGRESMSASTLKRDRARKRAAGDERNPPA